MSGAAQASCFEHGHPCSSRGCREVGSSFARPGKAGPLPNSAQVMIPSSSNTPLLHGTLRFVGFQLCIHELTHHGFIYLFGSIVILGVHCIDMSRYRFLIFTAVWYSTAGMLSGTGTCWCHFHRAGPVGGH